jgi:molybdopterin molybdotransferase
VLSVEEARDRILNGVKPLAPIELPLLAEYDLPPFSAAETDGYALRAADVHVASKDAPTTLRIVGEVTQGRHPEATVGWGEAVRVESGAAVPAGADSVVPLDRCRVRDDAVAVLRGVEEGGFVTPAGRDVRAGDVLVPSGRRLSSPELAVLASAGRAAPPAYPKVRVAVLSIGDLVEPGRPVAFGQVRDVGSYGIYGALRDAGAVPYRVGVVPDAESEVREAVLTNLARADCFVCTTGTDESLEADVLGELADIELVQTAMRPGSHHGFGFVEGAPLFVLPRAPVSAFVIFEVLIRPAILRMMARRDLRRPEVEAILDEDVDGSPEATSFVPARVDRGEGGWHARPSGPADPELLHTVVDANGLIVVAPGAAERSAGARVPVRLFRPLERQA